MATTAQLFEVGLFFALQLRQTVLAHVSKCVFLMQYCHCLVLIYNDMLHADSRLALLSRRDSAQLFWFGFLDDQNSSDSLDLLCINGPDGHPDLLKLIFLCMQLAITFCLLFIIVFVILTGTL